MGNVIATVAKQRTLERNYSILQPSKYRILPVGRSVFAKIDIEDFDRLAQYRWYLDGNGYAVTDHHPRRSMQREIIRYITGGVAPKRHIDHINGDKLDNRRSNLRVVSPQQNAFNSRPTHGTSKFKGVSRHTTSDSWVATIHIDRKKIHIGSFADELDAAVAYDIAAIQLYGEYAWLNIVGR